MANILRKIYNFVFRPRRKPLWYFIIHNHKGRTVYMVQIDYYESHSAHVSMSEYDVIDAFKGDEAHTIVLQALGLFDIVRDDMDKPLVKVRTSKSTIHLTIISPDLCGLYGISLSAFKKSFKRFLDNKYPDEKLIYINEFKYFNIVRRLLIKRIYR